jgi:tetratricopeptide (TPR) repeat protein
MVNGLAVFWNMHGHLVEACDICKRVAYLGGAAEVDRAEVLRNAGVFARLLGNPDEAHSLLSHACELYGRVSDDSGLARAKQQLAILSLQAGNPEEALKIHQESLALFQTTGDLRAQCGTLASLGIIHKEVGELTAASECFEQGLAIALQCGDPLLQAQQYTNIGFVRIDQGDTQVAKSFLEIGRKLASENGHVMGTALCLINLGTIALEVDGAVELGERLSLEAMNLAQQAHLAKEGAIATLNLATVNAKRREFPRAILRAQQALMQFEQIWNVRLIADTLEDIAEFHSQCDRKDLGLSIQLIAAAKEARKHFSVVQADFRHPRCQATISSLRRRLSQSAFRSAWNNGSDLDLEAAIDKAMNI